MQVVASIAAAFLMDRAGRKTLLIGGAATTCLSLAALGGYFYMKDQDSEWAKDTIGWLPLTSLIIYIVAVNLGFNTVQYVILAELLSPEIKGVAASIAMMPRFILGFVLVTTFVPMQVNKHT
ncbi:hypothetical protein SK128_011517 [Halocaridina rubra]|uniref:Major facilitator superfamily (MFS) profile domain-containing protein n=1 Tax=Halocaridina rubra TaxID=373956 RepID=A0AAN8X6X4_HALRR